MLRNVHTKCTQNALKFNLVLKPLDTDLCYFGVGTNCKSPPFIKMNAWGDEACLFHSISILLSGKDTYSAIIRHVVCNYIRNPVKYAGLKMYIATHFKMDESMSLVAKCVILKLGEQK